MHRNFFLILLCILAAAFGAHAHSPGLSTLKLQHLNNQIRAELIFSPVDLESIIPLDQNSDGTISKEEIQSAEPVFDKLARNLLTVSLDGESIVVIQTKMSQDENDSFRGEMQFAVGQGSVLKVESKWFDLLPPGHRQFVSFQEGEGAAITEDLLDAANNTFTVEIAGASVPTNPPPSRRSFSEFLLLGIHHIVTGYDHLLFLFALLVVCQSFSSIAKIVTCFTLAHSITLAFATLNVVEVSSRFIEPAIAASIIYVGAENIFRHGHPKGRWLLTFAFGLIHGFGFASVLREMEIAKAGSVVIPLISFNLGVEIGQIAVAAVMLPILWRLQRLPQFTSRWVPACSLCVIAAGSYWFIQRVWF